MFEKQSLKHCLLACSRLHCREKCQWSTKENSVQQLSKYHGATPVNYHFGVCVCVCSLVSHVYLVLPLADRVFGPGEKTKDLFEVIGMPIVDGVINGVNGVCVCVCECVCVCVCMCVYTTMFTYMYVCMYVSATMVWAFLQQLWCIDTTHVVLAHVVLVLCLNVDHIQRFSKFLQQANAERQSTTLDHTPYANVLRCWLE